MTPNTSPLIALLASTAILVSFSFNAAAATENKDTYKLMDAVHDGATLQILYEGRTADTALKDKQGFDAKFEDLFRRPVDLVTDKSLSNPYFIDSVNQTKTLLYG